MASSSSAIDSCNDYAVFLSFRGMDTRYGFTSHLYGALCSKNIKAFMDNKIKRGEEITPAIERVIEGAKISIIVFSENFADSSFCLDELVKIMECRSREFNKQTVFPIFYKVDPSKDTYQEAFARHGKKIELEMKVERWKSAFGQALEVAGWPIDDKCVENEIIKKITRRVLEELNCSRSKGQKLICTSVIGQTAEDSLKKIWNCLMNDKTSRVGVHGMGGVGKTTIATLINNQLLEDANSFTDVYWVTVSKDSSTFKLQSDIAKVINLDFFGEDNEKKRAAKLWEELKSKKFVLILDDVWKEFETEHVGIPLLAGGGKFLLTTRKREVCERMECQSIEVKSLSKGEARDLFMKESKCQINDSLGGKEIVESVVSKCAGLPLAIVVAARCMRRVVEISLWQNFLTKLERPCQRLNPEMEENVYTPLKVSYDCLHNDQYRQCLLYCSFFPAACEIQRNGLIDYWIAEGLIDELDSRLEKLDQGNAIINELISASLLENGRLRWKESVKMHDVVRDMVLIIRRENKVKVVQPQDLLKETEWGVDIGSVSEMDNTLKRCDSNSAPNSSKLKILLLRENYISELPCGFFANMPNLTVLDVHFLEKLKVLPNSITNLGNLRVLILRECSLLEYVPSLGGLKNLRHLHLSDSSLKKIPKGMDRLLNLRVLKLLRNSYLYGLFPSAVLEKLSHLQSLELEGSNVKVELNAVISLKKLEKLSVNLCNFVSGQRNFYNFIGNWGLRNFCDLQLHDLSSYFKSEHCRRLVEYNFVNFQDVNSDYVEHRRLSLRLLMSPTCKKALSLEPIKNVGAGEGETDIVFPDDIQQLQLADWDSPMVDVLRNTTFANLKKLNIWGYKGRYLFMPALAQQLLHNVEELTIGGPRNEWQQAIVARKKESKKKREKLLKELEDILGTRGELTKQSYRRIKLRQIMATEEELEDIMATEPLSKLEDIVATEEESINQSNCNSYPIIELPKLKSLTLNHLYELTNIYRGRLVCPSLGSIFIDGCCELERLPFYMQEEGNEENRRIKLWIRDNDANLCWWGSLKWDNPNAKSKFVLTC